MVAAASPRSRSVALVGAMGAGKSTVGQALAAALGLAFVDVDVEITRQAGRSIAALFEERGEAAFRALERDVLAALLRGPPQVLACGGGAVLDAGSREALRGVDTLWLAAEPRTLADRIAGDAGRPLAGDAEAMRVLLRRRRAAYADVALAVVRTDLEGEDDDPGFAVASTVGRCLAVLTAVDDARTGRAGVDVEATPAGTPCRLVGGRAAWERALPGLVRLAGAGIDLVTDPRVDALHGGRVRADLQSVGCEVRRHLLPGDEAHKDLPTWSALMGDLLASGADRDRLIVALGGGVVCDMAGFAAATLLRGVRHVLLPTTVLAQVDASIGGKTGVDTPLGKNLIGAFHQPRLVVCEPSWLSTLPERERRAGLAEIVKTALVRDAGLLEHLEQDADALAAGDAEALARVSGRTALAKLEVVVADSHEGGLRRCLNFGHTIGHAIEREAGFGVVLHGEAVAIGMIAALRVGVSLGVGDAALVERVGALLERLGLPVQVPSALTWPALVEATRHDKKAHGRSVRFVLVPEPGTFETRDVDAETLLAAWHPPAAEEAGR